MDKNEKIDATIAELYATGITVDITPEQRDEILAKEALLNSLRDNK
jgi:hypothetical protein